MVEGPAAEGFGAVVSAGEWSEVADPGLAGWTAVVGWLVGGGVVQVAGAAGGGGVGEAVDRGDQVDGFADPGRDLVAIDRV